MLNRPVRYKTKKKLIQIVGPQQILLRNSLSYQRGYEIDAGHVVHVVDLDVAPDTLVSTALDRALEYVGVVEVLHRLGAQVYAQVLQLTRLGILETEHVQDTDETVGGVSHRVI